MEVSDSPLKNVGGRPRRTDWQEPYLARIRKYGTKFLSAREVNVPWSVVWEECERNQAFADELRTALQEFADRCEEILVGQGLGAKGNPLPMFALLKKHRPAEYVEKAMSFNVTVDIDVPTDQARQVLGEMLAHVTPATVERLTSGERSEPAPALPLAPQGSVAPLSGLILDVPAVLVERSDGRSSEALSSERSSSNDPSLSGIGAHSRAQKDDAQPASELAPPPSSPPAITPDPGPKALNKRGKR